MAKQCFLGIDTSCYTTSLALVDDQGTVLQEERLLLPVALGEHGLRQSEGLFHHVRQLPQLLQRLPLSNLAVQAVGVSSRPRPVDDSYMPVFLAGVLVSESVSAALGVPLYRFSHQEGHLAAGLEDALGEEFMAMHISGGTSELLRVTPDPAAGFSIELLAGTSDLHAGQMIDRVGVALGLPFPAGPHLERLAQTAQGRVALPSSVDGLDFSFSGPCSAAERLIAQGQDGAEIAFAVLRMVANTLEKVLRTAKAKWGYRMVLLVGGVLSNQLIRERLVHRLGSVCSLVFAPPELSSDNAVGIARLARQRHRFTPDYTTP